MKKQLKLILALSALLFFIAPQQHLAVNPVDCTQAAVQNAINATANGGTINVPAGTCSWSAGITINNGKKLIGAGKTTGGTVITSGAVTVTKSTVSNTRLSGFRFTAANISVGGSSSAEPFIIDNNHIQGSGGSIVSISVNGGLLYDNDFILSPSIGGNFFFIHAGEDWSQPHTIGTADTTGERNIYFEDNTFTGFQDGAPDGDEGGRIVIRYNTLFDSSLVVHSGQPADTSEDGHRHVEIYNNTFDRVSNTVNFNKWIWIRGGTGVIANNVMERADSPDGSSYTGKAEIQLGINCSGNPPWPLDHQVGQIDLPADSTPSHPLLIFGNTGAGATDSNFIGLTESGGGVGCSNPGFYIQQNRDYYRTNQWSWTPYPYPHPLQGGGPADTTPPIPGGSGTITTSGIGQTSLTLNWTAGLDETTQQSNLEYAVYRSTTNNIGSVANAEANGTLITNYTTNIITSNATSLTCNTSYWFNVLVRDQALNKAAYTQKNETTATCSGDSTPPSAPTNLSAVAASSSQINLSWTASTDNVGVTGYRVERCLGATCSNFSEVGTPSGTTFSDTTLAEDSTYNYRVRATDAALNLSLYSSTDNSTTAPPTLLSGNNGIAAGFPSDTNITNHANVLFADNFESYASASGLTANWNNFYQGGNTRIATEAGNFYKGAKALEFTLPTSGTETSNAVVKNITPTQDVLHVRSYIRFASDYNIGAGVSNHNGITISAQYSGPGNIPNGSDFFLVLVENMRWLSEGVPGFIHNYVYHPAQRDNFGDNWYPDGVVLPFSGIPGDYGPFFTSRPNWNPTLGQWYSYELRVKANTPDHFNGRVTVWVDGEIKMDFPNLRFRDISTLKIDQIQLQLHAASSNQANRMYYDNTVIATSYIGPLVETGAVIGESMGGAAKMRIRK